MEIIATEIPDVKVIRPRVFADDRGYFLQTYQDAAYRAAGISAHFCQDNESCSSRGVLRGLHYQTAPHTQAKLVRVIQGAVWDVAVDIRKGSPTFGKYASRLLTGENKLQFYIPRGFAHGFVVLEDHTVFAYKCDNGYAPQADTGLLYNDPAIGIQWPDLGMEPILSAKDLRQPRLSEITPWEGA